MSGDEVLHVINCRLRVQCIGRCVASSRSNGPRDGSRCIARQRNVMCPKHCAQYAFLSTATIETMQKAMDESPDGVIPETVLLVAFDHLTAMVVAKRITAAENAVKKMREERDLAVTTAALEATYAADAQRKAATVGALHSVYVPMHGTHFLLTVSTY